MRLGPRTYQVKGTIDYKQLREFNPQAARMAVLEYLKTNPNVSQTARMFGITRPVVYDILKKEREGDLKDRSRGTRASAKENTGSDRGQSD